jgi:hypothetical protein
MAPQVQRAAKSRIAIARALKFLDREIAVEDIKDVRKTLTDVTQQSLGLLERLRQDMEGEPNAGQFHAYERMLDRTMEMVKALEAMDRGREDKNTGPQVIVIDSRLPSERGDVDIIDDTSHELMP